jgi:Lon protease-like protein
MAEQLLPLFPLEAVLLPGTPMPLHIFEDRYKELIGASIANKTEFGIVQAGEKGILNVGCTATIEKVIKRYPDGTMDIIVVGRRRFEIIMLDEQADYLRAEVSFFDDIDPDPPPSAELRALILAELRLLQRAEEFSEAAAPEPLDPRLSFKAAFFLPDLPFRQTLLSIRSESERLKQISDYLPDYIAKVRRTAHIRRIAPRNGHGMITSE